MVGSEESVVSKKDNALKVQVEVVSSEVVQARCGRGERERQLLRGKSHSHLMVGEERDQGEQKLRIVYLLQNKIVNFTLTTQ